jgi:hypothetical protein
MANNMTAARQWATRPPDQRFWTVADLLAATRKHYESAGDVTVDTKQLEIVPVDVTDVTVKDFELGDLRLVGPAYREAIRQNKAIRQNAEAENLIIDPSELIDPSDFTALFTDYSFRQFCQRIGAKADYLSTLPANIVAAAMNFGISRMGDDAKSVLLVHKNGANVLRAATSEIYARVWNWELAQWLQELIDQYPAWGIPPGYPVEGCEVRQATAEDAKRSLTIREKDSIGPSGAYASDRDMFVFLTNYERVIEVGNDKLQRGFFAKNSEVGDASISLTGFAFDGPCGNHICWNYNELFNMSMRHVGGDLRLKISEAYAAIKASADASVEPEVRLIKAAKAKVLGADKDEVVETVFNNRKLGISQKDIEAAYDLAVIHEDTHGAPNTVWGVVSGLTRQSQTLTTAKGRTELDRKAGKLLQLAA